MMDQLNKVTAPVIVAVLHAEINLLPVVKLKGNL